MTTVLIAELSPVRRVPLWGFSQGDQDTWIRWNYYIPSPGFEFIAVTVAGEAIFPENFSHKRAYIKILKAEKAKPGPYRFDNELITLFDSLDVYTFQFWVGMVDDFPGFDRLKRLNTIHDIIWPTTTQTLFEPDVCYCITKPAQTHVLKPGKKQGKGRRF